MKLAEALSLRKDLEKRISGLKDRLENVARIQEDEEPSENPEELMTELDRCLEQLEQLIYNINVTNVKIVCEDVILYVFRFSNPLRSLYLKKFLK